MDPRLNQMGKNSRSVSLDTPVPAKVTSSVSP